MFRSSFILLVLSVFLLTSCNSKGCYENMEVKVYCGMYSTDTQESTELDHMTVYGAGSDSLLYEDQTIDELAFELHPTVGKTQFVVQRTTDENTVQDTITFFHTNEPWFQSMECGCMVFSTIDSCKTTGSIFKSATIINPEINNKKTEHVHLNL